MPPVVLHENEKLGFCQCQISFPITFEARLDIELEVGTEEEAVHGTAYLKPTNRSTRHKKGRAEDSPLVEEEWLKMPQDVRERIKVLAITVKNVTDRGVWIWSMASIHFPSNFVSQNFNIPLTLSRSIPTNPFPASDSSQPYPISNYSEPRSAYKTHQ